jgi:hypothetical protein
MTSNLSDRELMTPRRIIAVEMQNGDSVLILVVLIIITRTNIYSKPMVVTMDHHGLQAIINIVSFLPFQQGGVSQRRSFGRDLKMLSMISRFVAPGVKQVTRQ